MPEAFSPGVIFLIIITFIFVHFGGRPDKVIHEGMIERLYTIG